MKGFKQFNTSEFSNFVDYILEEAPKKAKAFISDDAPLSTAHEPRLSGKASKVLAKDPNMLCRILLDNLCKVYKVQAADKCERMNLILDQLGVKNRNILASLVVASNLITMQMKCMTKRFFPSQLLKKEHVKIEIRKNTKYLEHIGVALNQLYSLSLHGIGKSNYSHQLNCIAPFYAKMYEREYNCAPGAFSCQTMERINWYWKNLVACRRPRGKTVPLKTGGTKRLMSLHQQRMAKFYFVSIYGNMIDKTPQRKRQQADDISLDPSESYMLGLADSKTHGKFINLFEDIEGTVNFSELTNLQELLNATIKCYFKRPCSEMRAHLIDMYTKSSKVEYDKEKLEDAWDKFASNAKLYEFAK